MKRFLAIILTVCLMLTVMPLGLFNLTASAANTTGYYGSLKYEVNHNEVTITDCSLSAEGTIVIPSEISSYSVTSIGDEAFFNCKSITSVIIGNNVKSIGYYAFAGCSSLTSITIPNSVTSISDDAWRISGIKNVYITDIAAWCNIDFETYDSNPLYYADNLYLNGELITNLVIPNSVTNIGNYAFGDYSRLTSVTIPDSVESIGNYAFNGCENLANVFITDIAAWCNIDFETYDSNPLYYADNLYLNGELITDLVIPEGVTTIPPNAFSCNNITRVTIPNSVTSIGDSAFENCENLTSVSIPDSVTSIGFCAFSGCKSLTSVTIPNSVISIGAYAFRDCKSFKSVTIPDSVTSIGNNAFENCTGLISITIPTSVTSIGPWAFYGCTALKNVYYIGSYSDKYEKLTITSDNECLENATWHYSIESNLIYVYDDDNLIATVSDCCKEARWITIPSVVIKNGKTYSVTGIDSYAFENCTGLISITIPASITSIGNGAFKGCNSLESITLPFVGSSRTASGTFDAVFGYIFGYTRSSDSSGTTNQYYSNGSSCYYYIPSSLKSVTITDTEQIPDKAFYNCTNLTSVTIPDSVTSIGYQAFENCTGLTSIILPFVGNTLDGTSENHFGYIFGAFRYLSNYKCVPSSLKKVVITKATSIGSNAFYGCSSLTSITIPDSVTSIGSGAFYDCESLANVFITDIAAWCNIDFEDYDSNPLYYAENLYLNNQPVTDVVIPQGVTTVPRFAFSCNSLTSITIPDSVRSIGGCAFRHCDSLEDVFITDIAAWCNIDFEDYDSNPLYYAENLYLNNQPVTDVVIPQGVTTVPKYAFSCNSLTSITMPNSVTSIGDGAFYGCDSLTSVTIPDGVKSISDWAFYDCDGLTSVTIGKGVTSIGDSAFENCDSLTSVTIPDSVTSIGDSAFYDCKALNKIYYLGTCRQKAKIGIGSFNSCLSSAKWNYNNSSEEDHIYDNSCDTTCNICKDLRATQHSYTLNHGHTCDICKYSKAPTAPMVEKKDSVSVTLIATDGFEYSKNGTSWQTSNVFTGLSGGNTYTFYQRVKESSFANVSETSDALTITLKSVQVAPTALTVLSFTDSTVTLLAVNGCEYSIDGVNWQNSNVFTGLSPATTYTFYQRYAETPTAEASTMNSISQKTDKATQTNIPPAPTIAALTSSSITLNTVDGCEYSKNGTTWQSSPTFGDLSCGTEYTFYQRYKETDTTYAGKCSVALKIRTDKGVQLAPEAPVLSSKTYNSVTLTAINGYEYSRDGINWQTSNVFEELEGETNYIFYQRKSETDTHYASNASSGLVIKTSEAPLCIYDPRKHIYTNDCDTDCNSCGQTRTTTHNYEWITDKQNNCGVDGIKHEECTVCHEKRNENTPIGATGQHIYTNDCDTDCNSCGQTRTTTHNYEWITDKQNNCGVNGIKHEECTVCHEKRNENTLIGATGQHSYSDNSDLTCETCGFVREPLYIPGDLDGVEGVTDADAEYLLMYTFFPEDYPVNQECDFNGDGKVNDADAEHLLMFTFFPEDYPLH